MPKGFHALFWLSMDASMCERTFRERDAAVRSGALALWAEWPQDTRRWFLGEREGLFFLEDAFRGRSLHFDPEGRPRRVVEPGAAWLRGYDGRCVRKTRAGGSPAPRPQDAADAFRRAHETVQEAYVALTTAAGGGGGRSGATPPAAAAERLERALRWTPAALAVDAARFLDAYEPLGILPPDAYRTLILQATTGCRYDRCRFCTLYEGRRHRVRTLEEFRDHAERVRRFFGRALAVRRGVFLGEANALEVPAADLLSMMKTARAVVPEVFDPEPRFPFRAFVDAFDREPPRLPDLVRLREHGLLRVYIGAESGSDRVLRFLSKPATRGRLEGMISRLKEAGIAVGVIFLAGAGGRNLRGEHLEHSVDLARGLPLDERDLLYVSPLRGTALERLADPPLTRSELDTEAAELLRSFRALGLRASLYDIESFVYG